MTKQKLFANKMWRGFAVVFLITIYSLCVSHGVWAAFPGTNGAIIYSDIGVNGNGDAAFNIVNDTFSFEDKQTVRTGIWASGTRYSADGQKIAFSDAQDYEVSTKDIFIMNNDGTGLFNVTNFDTNDPADFQAYSPSFNAQGDRVVYVKKWFDSQNICHLFSRKANGTDEQQLTNQAGACDSLPVYSPDGSRIAFLRSMDIDGNLTDLYVMNSDGTDQQLVVSNVMVLGSSDSASLAQFGINIDWSPDGSKIVYANYSQVDETTTASSVMLTDLQGSAVPLYTVTGLYPSGLFGSSFTPEGQIIFREITVDGEVFSNYRIALMNSDGGGIRTLKNVDLSELADPMYAVYNHIGLTVQPVPYQSILAAENGSEIRLSKSGCGNFSNLVASKEMAQTILDSGYDYPAGFVSFKLNNCGEGGSADITMTFTGLGDASKYRARKFNSTTQTYVDIPGAIITNTTVNGTPAVQLSYTVVDGGSLDEDGVADGTIIDPAGLGAMPVAANTATLANTGKNTSSLELLSLGLVCIGALYLIHRRCQRSLY